MDRRRFTQSALALPLVGVNAVRAATTEGPHIARIEAQVFVGDGKPTPSLAARMQQLRIPGLGVAFADRGGVVWSKTYGLADASEGRAATTETLFQAASISKPVTAVAALRMVEAGLLSLDEDVNARLKAWTLPSSPFTASEKVTLRRLLSHTAGLSVQGFAGFKPGEALPTELQILDGARPAKNAPIKSIAVPGQAFRYSGGGYAVLQLLLTETTSMPFDDLMDHWVFRPAGMTNSTFALEPSGALRRRFASAHGRGGRTVREKRRIYPMQAPAGLWATPSDVALFASQIVRAYAGQPAIISRATAQAMMRPGVAGSTYGLGVQYLAPIGATGSRFGHGGSNLGFKSLFLAGTETGRCAVVMTNGEAGERLCNELIGTITRAYQGS